MSRFNFYGESYDKDFIEQTIIDGDINNFKGDYEFLEFIMQWVFFRDFYETKSDCKYKKYSNDNAILNFIRLDEYDLLDKKLYKIYEICGKDKKEFIRVCYHIGNGLEKLSFSIDEINTNLLLKEPVSFIDRNVKIPDVDKIDFNFGDKFNPYNLNIDQLDEYNYELKRSLRHRINLSIKENGDDVKPLEEMMPYTEEVKNEKIDSEKMKVKDDYILDINNVYYGKQNVGVSSESFGLGLSIVSFFEDTKTALFKFRIFKSIPAVDYCLLDESGKLYIPDQILSKDNIKIGPNSPIRSVEIINVLRLFKLVIEKLQENPIDNELEILNYQGMKEVLTKDRKLSFGDLKKYEPIIKNAYEFLFGPIFSDEKDIYNDISDNYDSPKK